MMRRIVKRMEDWEKMSNIMRRGKKCMKKRRHKKYIQNNDDKTLEYKRLFVIKLFLKNDDKKSMCMRVRQKVII
jgi:hypothetical protein